MRRIVPLLGLETNRETTVVYMQRRVKHVSTTIKVLLISVISIRSGQRGYKKNNWATQLAEGQAAKRRLGGSCEMAASQTIAG
jgi:hypothetical protein